MYPHQTDRLTGALDAAGGEALVATSAANVAYVTGFRSLTHAVLQAPQFGVFTRRGTALVIPALDLAAALADGVDVDHVQCYGAAGTPGTGRGPLARRLDEVAGRSAPTAAEALAAALAMLGVREGPVALDQARLSGDAGQEIADRLRPLRVTSGSAPFAAARRVKGPFEIECLIGALHIAEEALNEVIQMLKRGVTEREATTLYLAEAVKRGGEPSPSAITMGDRTALGAAWPSERALRAGELIRLDVGCTRRGYAARVGRTAILGEPTPAHETAHGAIHAALEAAVEVAEPGRPASEVYEAARRAMREQGLPDVRWAGIGHGIGLELGERPSLAPGDETPLEAGEVLGIELAHQIVGEQGYLVRDTVLVTVAGARVLNRSARGLVALD